MDGPRVSHSSTKFASIKPPAPATRIDFLVPQLRLSEATVAISIRLRTVAALRPILPRKVYTPIAYRAALAAEVKIVDTPYLIVEL